MLNCGMASDLDIQQRIDIYVACKICSQAIHRSNQLSFGIRKGINKLNSLGILFVYFLNLLLRSPELKTSFPSRSARCRKIRSPDVCVIEPHIIYIVTAQKKLTLCGK